MLGTPTFETNRVCLCISQAKREQFDKPELGSVNVARVLVVLPP